ncbi:MAG: hypothetical protein OXQ89_05145 [Rhodospirillaceae bacterium]|nr:hypothetical protein [Rhodospirillaceae bacterium]MDD9997112.1 hypothetical protein [Rhodospirillaceae bacterium]MDE0363029.1 hypothetical protein [Rhodospirillaceae bacterium]
MARSASGNDSGGGIATVLTPGTEEAARQPAVSAASRWAKRSAD